MRRAVLGLRVRQTASVSWKSYFRWAGDVSQFRRWSSRIALGGLSVSIVFGRRACSIVHTEGFETPFKMISTYSISSMMKSAFFPARDASRKRSLT